MLGNLHQKSIIHFIILIIFSSFYTSVHAAESKEGEPFNAGDMIMHHIADSHEWEFAKGFVAPLPIILYVSGDGFEVFSSKRIVKTGQYGDFVYDHGKIKHLDPEVSVYDFSITKNVAQMFLSIILILPIFLLVARNYKKRANQPPKGIAAVFEPIIIYIRDEIAKPNIGPKYERFMPYLLTVFFYIWFNNILGLLPGAANLTGNIAVTAVLAVITFIITQINGTKHYWGHIFNTPGVPWWLKYPLPLMPLVEVLGIFTKPFSLMIRLFANITAGHIIILSLLSLIFIFKSAYLSLVSIPFAVFMNFLELLVALLQAYIFTLLSSIYFGSAVEEHHEPEEKGASQSLI